MPRKDATYKGALAPDTLSRLRLPDHQRGAALALPERYTYMNEKDYWRLKGMNVRFQLNLLSLVGAYGPEVRGKAEWLLKNGYYQLCGTDIHSLTLWKESVMKKRISGNVSRMLQGIIATHFPG